MKLSGGKGKSSNNLVSQMSERWEEAIQHWYTHAHTSNLEYLDLANHTKPTHKELAHNISVIHDRVCLSSRVHLRNFKLLLEKEQNQEKEIQKLTVAVKALTTLFAESRPLAKQEVRDWAKEIFQQGEVIGFSTDLSKRLQSVEHSLAKIERLFSLKKLIIA